MSSNTQDNTYSTGQTNKSSTERQGIDTGRTGYDSTQQQYGQGTTTAQYDSSRFGEEGTEGDVGQKQYGRGQGGIDTGVAAGGAYLGQDTGFGGGDMKATTDSSLRPAEQTTQAYRGDDPSAGATTLGYGIGTQGGYGGDTGRYAGDTTLGSGTGTDNQYPTTGHHGGHHHGHHQEATGTGVKPSMTDKIIGGVEKVTGKVTSNTEMYQRGEERAAGETPKKNY